MQQETAMHPTSRFRTSHSRLVPVVLRCMPAALSLRGLKITGRWRLRSRIYQD